MTRWSLIGALIAGLTINVESYGTSYYVAVDVSDGGDGSMRKPFNSLARAEEVSKAGDVIYIVAHESEATLDGGIALKPRQKLIGLDADGEVSKSGRRLTNSTEHLDGVIVKLSEGNEIAGIHFVDLQSHGVHGGDSNLSGTNIHHCRFTGARESDELILSILFETHSGLVQNVKITDCAFEDGEDLAGIRVMHAGASTGDYEFARNEFRDLGGRAYMIWSRGESHLSSRILDSSADNIGRGDRNADSILPRLWGQSKQTMLVQNYRYDNSKGVGNRSNTGLEVFLMGEPFRNEDEWCDGCAMTLTIEDCVFENSVTDGIQLTNYGSNSVLDFTIRNTKIIGANPQQAGGAISLIAQNQYNTGSRSKLLVENCTIIDSGKYGFAILDRSGEYTSTVDLGGGALGSKGNNRVINSAEAEVMVMNANPIAKGNDWGGKTPRARITGDKSTLDLGVPHWLLPQERAEP